MTDYREIKNAIRTAHAVASHRSEPLCYHLLTEVLEMIGEFGDFEGACECGRRKWGYFGGGDRGNYLRDAKAGSGRTLV